MKHPSQAALALQAGGDLGFISRWRVERHLAHCDDCRRALEAYQITRQILPDLAEIPEIPWNRLAAEMKANIRLGLEAGECVRLGDPPLRETRWFTGTRAAVAFASIAVLLVTGAVLERPVPVTAPVAAADEGMVIQATEGGNGIQAGRSGQALRLMNPAQRVLYSTDAQGSMRARYVDPETGYVTINNVYAE